MDGRGHHLRQGRLEELLAVVHHCCHLLCVWCVTERGSDSLSYALPTSQSVQSHSYTHSKHKCDQISKTWHFLHFCEIFNFYKLPYLDNQ